MSHDSGRWTFAQFAATALVLGVAVVGAQYAASTQDELGLQALVSIVGAFVMFGVFGLVLLGVLVVAVQLVRGAGSQTGELAPLGLAAPVAGARPALFVVVGIVLMSAGVAVSKVIAVLGPVLLALALAFAAIGLHRAEPGTWQRRLGGLTYVGSVVLLVGALATVIGPGR